MEFTFSKRAKNFTFALMGIGLVGLIIGVLTDHSDHASNRIWANVLVNGFFFFAISLGALFFLALQYATEAAWGTVLKRVFEAVMGYLPIGIVVIALIMVASSLHMNHLYHWMDGELYDKTSHHYDPLIANKGTYLNVPFFLIRTFVYLATFFIFMRSFRKRSLLEDQVGGTDLHFKNYRQGALFLVFFAVFSSTMAWDWLMSLDPHWFSTMYGWYVFSGMWVSAIITFIMIVLYLQGQGYLKQVNESHIHDLGKWMFAISFLWSYIWFFQFMLIWYSNIPEEITYFKFRIEHYNVPFFMMFAVNFILPMLFLMSREAKRHRKILTIIGLVIFLGHWFDVYVLVMPATVFEEWHYGLLEIGMFLVFLGSFIYVVLNNLTKSPLVPVQHPYLDESIHHHI
jgi:type IV secretory pathway VirB2 component (pilin)